jgi:dTDP-4-dehydrorhamnose 3,5-epimerase
MLWVPPYFAHGFYVISDSADFQYKSTDFYDPESEQCIVWNDPELNIQWPLVDNTLPQLSDKDQKGQRFSRALVFD